MRSETLCPLKIVYEMKLCIILIKKLKIQNCGSEETIYLVSELNSISIPTFSLFNVPT